MYKKKSFKIFLVLALSGCSANTINETSQLSSSSSEYTKALITYLNEVEDSKISYSNFKIIRARPNPKEKITNELKKEISKDEELTLDFIKELGNFRYNIEILNEYFFNLKLLAENQATKETIDSLNALAVALYKLPIDNENNHKKATNIIITNYNAYKIKEIMKRDHKIVSNILSYNTNQLSDINDQLKEDEDKLMNHFKKENIVNPYFNLDQPIPPTWEENRKKWIKYSYSSENFNKAIKISKDLQSSWESLSTDQSSLNNLSSIIIDLNEFNSIILDLKKVNESN